MDTWLAIALIAAALILGAVATFIAYKKAFSKGVEHRKKEAEAQIESAEKDYKETTARGSKRRDIPHERTGGKGYPENEIGSRART